MFWSPIKTPAEVGRAVDFLASDDADYISGASLLVDGGLALRAARPLVSPAGTNHVNNSPAQEASRDDALNPCGSIFREVVSDYS